jgi:hypothetical protein
MTEARLTEERMIEKLRRDHPIDAFDCGQEALNSRWGRNRVLQPGCWAN